MLADSTKSDWGRIALWGGVTVLSFVIFAVVVFVMRRKLRDSGGTHTDIFDLQELQAMKDRGDINEAEYKALRTRAVDSIMMQGNRQNRG